jgi:uncharacterized membrane protein YeaQ/YmgE (transglycosylase-associated protein family)
MASAGRDDADSEDEESSAHGRRGYHARPVAARTELARRTFSRSTLPACPASTSIACAVSLVALLLLLLVAGICGSIGRALAGYSHTGCLASVALGFIGALLGVWLARALRLPELFFVNVAGERFPVVWSIVGSALFVAVLSMFSRRG